MPKTAYLRLWYLRSREHAVLYLLRAPVRLHRCGTHHSVPSSCGWYHTKKQTKSVMKTLSTSLARNWNLFSAAGAEFRARFAGCLEALAGVLGRHGSPTAHRARTNDGIVGEDGVGQDDKGRQGAVQHDGVADAAMRRIQRQQHSNNGDVQQPLQGAQDQKRPRNRSHAVAGRG